MSTEERLENLERELARARRRNRWLMGGLAVGLYLGLLVLAGTTGIRTAGAQGGGAVASSPCHYQLAVAPGYYCGQNTWVEADLYLLDQTTGRLFKLDRSKDPRTGKTREAFWLMQCNGRLVLP